MKTLDITEREKISYCIPTELRDEHIRINCAKVAGRLGPEPAKDTRPEPIAIVCFGPSLKETWEELKNFRYIITCSGAHKFLIERGIIPTWHVELEPREHKIQMLGPPHKEVEYLVASTIHPRYIDALDGFKVKLWHIFAGEADGQRVLPRGECALTGGSSVGLRCMTIARFMGFLDLHIFGMDGNMRPGEGGHAALHPNAPPEKVDTVFDGKKYLTTPSMLFCAKETWKELNQLPRVTAKFYGEGLVQHMARHYIPKRSMSADIAFTKPELISKEYAELNSRLHRDNPMYGMGGAKFAQTAINLSKNLKTTSILDYGAGKRQLEKALPFPIWSYDPAVPEISAAPKPADIVFCTDVLEHIEPEKLQFVLDDLRRVTLKVGYFVINMGPAKKTYADGRNTHLIQEHQKWWEAKLSKFFEIAKTIVTGPSLHVVVGPKKNSSKSTPAELSVTPVKNGDVSCKFYTPNEATAWRARTILTKEPVTTAWVNSMERGDILFDVGANVGGYSVLAGTRGVKVFAFEPEAENFALLVRNMLLNGLKPTAYCLALSDRRSLGMLNMSQQGAGSSCHTFSPNSPTSLDFSDGPKQGCIGAALDELVETGQLPSPCHIKIDVDGLEPLVVKGAEKVLCNGVRSLLVEVNTNSPEHMEMVERLKGYGFTYDQAQVDGSIRKEGNFKGVAEYLFRKGGKPQGSDDNEVRTHLFRRISETPVITTPFPHLYIENVFPAAYYAEMLASLPKDYAPINTTRSVQGYENRFTAKPDDPFWKALNSRMRDGGLRRLLCSHFGVSAEKLTDETLLIRDTPGYSIGPHTDSPAKVITALFYLPYDESAVGAGTSIYEPKDSAFRCPGGPHHAAEGFNLLRTMPFKPNSVFIFRKTDNSFHGVEPCTVQRDVLLYDIRHAK